MARSDWVWMPHPGHFILGIECMFRLNTYVNGYIVSTVGDLVEKFSDYDKQKFKPIGSGKDDLFETAVFHAFRTDYHVIGCCKYMADHNKEQLECRRYKSPKEAVEGHYEFCDMFDSMKHGMNLDENRRFKFDIKMQHIPKESSDHSNQDFPFGPVPPTNHSLFKEIAELKKTNEYLKEHIQFHKRVNEDLIKLLTLMEKEGND